MKNAILNYFFNCGRPDVKRIGNTALHQVDREHIEGMIRTALTAAALALAAATPSMAETWVTYEDKWDRDGKHSTYQIDAASIASHKGWTHANHRKCSDYMSKCFKPKGVSAHCQQEELRTSTNYAITKIRRNGDEWWTSAQIKQGYRLVGRYEKEKELFNRAQAERDAADSALFNFLCKGE